MSNFFTLSLSLSFLRIPLLCLSLCFRLVSFFKSIFQFILFLLGLISCLIQSLSFSIIIVSSFSNLLVFFYNILFLMLPIQSLRILNIVKILTLYSVCQYSIVCSSWRGRYSNSLFCLLLFNVGCLLMCFVILNFELGRTFICGNS